nr:hypothetical protein CFP56_68663 [Quercus suber]
MAPSIPNNESTKATAHKISGHRIKKYECTYSGCPQTFTCPHNREQHIREKHTFQRPNVCHVCAEEGYEKAFARPFTLYRHLREVHKLHVPVGRGHRRRGMAGVMKLGNTKPPEPGQQQRTPSAQMATVDQIDVLVIDVAKSLEGPTHVRPENPRPWDVHLKICSICNAFAAANENEVVAHQHAFHGVPRGEHCLCAWCQETHSSSCARQFMEQTAPAARAEDARFEADLRAQLENFLNR